MYNETQNPKSQEKSPSRDLVRLPLPNHFSPTPLASHSLLLKLILLLDATQQPEPVECGEKTANDSARACNGEGGDA